MISYHIESTNVFLVWTFDEIESKEGIYMDAATSYLLIDKSIVPEVFVKVVEAKKYLSTGSCKTINEAIEKVKISRSAFYKYKNYVYPYNELSREKIFTFFFTLDDVSGILSDILKVFASYSTSVLTINQNIPVNNIANITISVRIGAASADVDSIIKRMDKIDGVHKIEILAME